MADSYHPSDNAKIKSLIALFRSFFSASLFLLLARVIGAGTGVGLQVVIARYYGAEILGNFYLAFGLAAVLSIILSMGFPWILAPILSRSENQGDSNQIHAFLWVAIKHLAAATALIAIPMMITIWILPSITGDLQLALLVAVMTAPIYALLRLISSLANARKYFFVANMPELIFRPVLILAFIVVAATVSLDVNSTVLMALNLVIITLLTGWIGFMLWMRVGEHKWPFGRSISGGPTVIDAATTRHWRKLAMPMILATLFVNLFADLDILIVGSILPAGQIGVFGVCIKITFIMAYAIQITHQILLRDASDAYNAGSQQQLLGVVSKANRYTIAVTLAGLIMTIAFGSKILEIFGGDFTAGYGCLIVLMSSQLVRAMAGPTIQMLMISGNQHASIKVYFVSTILLLVSNLIFVPSYGYIGAGAAVLLTTIYLVAALDRVVRKKLGFSVSIIS